MDSIGQQSGAPANDIKTVLRQLRHGQTGCALTSFADLETRLVLRSDSEGFIAQERLDQLCQLAAKCFDLREVAAAALPREQTEGERDIPVTLVLGKDSGESLIFSKAHEQAREALLCRFNTPEGAEAAIAATEHTATLLSGVK